MIGGIKNHSYREKVKEFFLFPHCGFHSTAIEFLFYFLLILCLIFVCFVVVFFLLKFWKIFLFFSCFCNLIYILFALVFTLMIIASFSVSFRVSFIEVVFSYKYLTKERNIFLFGEILSR